MMKKYWVVALLAGFAAACSAKEPELTAQQCWATFRQAVMADDYKKLQEMTQFPLVVRGAVDSIPAQKVERDQFKAMLEKILDQPLASYEGDKLVTYTQRELVSKTTALAKNHPPNAQFRIGELVFEQRGKNCKLVQAYLSE